MEIKTDKSVGAITRELKKVTDVSILNKLTNKKVVMRSPVSEEIEDLLQKLGLSH